MYFNYFPITGRVRFLAFWEQNFLKQHQQTLIHYKWNYNNSNKDFIY